MGHGLTAARLAGETPAEQFFAGQFIVAAKNVINRLVRTWSILERMQAKKRGVTAAMLQDELRIARATLYRDLDVLMQSPLPIRKETINGEVRYLLDEAAFHLPKPSTKQAFAVAMARRFLTALDGTWVVKELDSYLKLTHAIPPPHIASKPGEPTHDPTHAGKIERAIENNQRVRMTYVNAKGEDRERVIEPVELRTHAGQLYATAWDTERNGWRVFKMARVENVQVLEENAESHGDYDADEVFAHSVGVWMGEPVDVQIRISAEIARLATEHPLCEDATMTKEAGGSLLVQARVAGEAEAMFWALRWGRHAEVVAPEGLRRQMAAELKSAGRQYA